MPDVDADATGLVEAQALQALLDEQRALRRIAELIAQDAPVDVVLNAVAVQASRLAGVEFGMVHRFEPDGSTEIMAIDGAPENFAVGMRAPETGDGSVHRVWRTGRAARVDDLGAMSGQWPRMAYQYGFTRSAGVPVRLQGRMWGTIIVVGRDALLPPAIEQQLTDFAELVSTAIAAAQARAELRVLADEQAALRRVAELAARGAMLDEVFAAVATEASTLLGEPAAALLRHDPDEMAVVVAARNSPAPPGRRVRRADLAQELDRGAGVAVPVVVEGRVWGTLTVGPPGPPLPAGARDRLAQFAELAAAAIASAENKAKLTASRARVIATADETRRRVQRDLHDGAQQRLVHALIALKLAREAAAGGRPAVDLIDEALANVDRANRELRDLVRGILPAALTRGGLAAGLESLVADVSLPVDLRVSAPRLAAPTETTAYFVVAEALTNVVKHAHATQAVVDVALEGNVLSVLVHDDGTGGADLAHGSGLTGLSDRVEAHDGTLTVTSPRGGGTVVHATLPLAASPTSVATGSLPQP